MASAVGIVAVVLHLLRRNGDVFPVLSAPRIDLAADVFDFGRIAVRFVAAALGRIIRHEPGRVELLVNWKIGRGVSGVALLSESKYGYSTFGNELRMSLLRAPGSPDPGSSPAMSLRPLIEIAAEDERLHALAGRLRGAGGGEGETVAASATLRPLLLATLLEDDRGLAARPALLVSADDRSARDLAADLRAYLAPRRVRFLRQRRTWLSCEPC